MKLKTPAIGETADAGAGTTVAGEVQDSVYIATESPAINTCLGHNEETPSTKPLSRQQKWQLENPKAVWAHSCLRSAIRRGLITPEPCAECGALPTDGHHDNYDEPMNVRWLCRKHHRAVHRRGGN